MGGSRLLELKLAGTERILQIPQLTSGTSIVHHQPSLRLFLSCEKAELPVEAPFPVLVLTTLLWSWEVLSWRCSYTLKYKGARMKPGQKNICGHISDHCCLLYTWVISFSERDDKNRQALSVVLSQCPEACQRQ